MVPGKEISKGGTFQSKDQAFDEAKILLTSLPWPTSPAMLATFNVSCPTSPTCFRSCAKCASRAPAMAEAMASSAFNHAPAVTQRLARA